MIGRTLSRFQMLEELPATRTGEFFGARDLQADREVVLAFLPAGITGQPPAPSRAGNPEAELTPEGQLYLIFEAERGRALAKGLDRDPALPQAVDLVLTLGRALPGESNAWALAAFLWAIVADRSEEERAPELTALAQRTLAGGPGTSTKEFLAELRLWRTRSVSLPVQTLDAPWWSRPGAVIPVLALIGMGMAWWTHHNSRLDWARKQAVPEIRALGERILWSTSGDEAWHAYDLALEARAIIQDDPALVEAWRSVTTKRSFNTTPEGAVLWGAAFNQPDGPWRRIGTTPIQDAAFPRGISLVRFTRPGFDDLIDVALNVAGSAKRPPYRLAKTGEAPRGMVPARGEPGTVFLQGFGDLASAELGDFWIDRCEVTNIDFMRFRRNGGYREPRYWKHRFLDTSLGRELTFEEAMQRFVDTTGRAGPATWANGQPPGRIGEPVTGVSWYEAAAYAESMGRSLPTLFHWNLVSAPRASSGIVPNSNLEGDSLARTGVFPATHRFGTKDLAGNAREWCRNEVNPGGLRLMLGGAWNESAYAFLDPNAVDAFDRSPTNGFRCVIAIDEEPAELGRAVVLPTRDFLNETPADDDTFQRYLAQFDFEPTPFHDEVIFERELNDGRYEYIEFDAAYGPQDGRGSRGTRIRRDVRPQRNARTGRATPERMSAYLFLPSTGQPPYQTVVAFPGSELIGVDLEDPFADGARKFYYEFVLKSGRAVLFPVYKGLLNRKSGLERAVAKPTAQYRDHVIMWGKDLRRAVDYIEMREDLDADRLAYFGFNWGASMGAMMPAIEPRFDVSVLYVAGLGNLKPLPEVDAIHYVSRVLTPTLMINGEYDYLYPVETSQRPMFELLGCLPENKKWITFEGSHAIPREEFIKEALGWIDRYLGPVTL